MELKINTVLDLLAIIQAVRDHSEGEQADKYDDMKTELQDYHDKLIKIEKRRENGAFGTVEEVLKHLIDDGKISSKHWRKKEYVYFDGTDLMDENDDSMSTDYLLDNIFDEWYDADSEDEDY